MEQYEELLEQKKEELKTCQEEHSLDSCLLCPDVVECAKRKEYVKSVYVFLSGGQLDGEFDF